MNKTVIDYIRKYFDIKTEMSEWLEADRLPLYLRNTYDFMKVTLLDRSFLFTTQTHQEKMNLDTIKKHIERIRSLSDSEISIVMVSNQFSNYLRRQLIRERISFVVPGKQIFIPELGTLFTERGTLQTKTDETTQTTNMSPTTQALFLYLMTINDFSYPMETIAKKLDITRMSVSRGFSALAQLGILERYRGSQPGLYHFKFNLHDTWINSQKYLIDPVLKSFYVKETSIDPDSIQQLVLSGESALSEHSMLAAPTNFIYGISNRAFKQWFKDPEILPVSEPDTVTIQLFKHQLPSEHGILHPLSIALILKDEADARVRKEVELMINRYFKET